MRTIKTLSFLIIYNAQKILWNTCWSSHSKIKEDTYFVLFFDKKHIKAKRPQKRSLFFVIKNHT